MAQPLIESLPPSPGQLLLQNGSVYSSFQDPVEIITTRNPEDIKFALQELNDAVAQFGYYAAGFLTYEAAAAYRLAVRQPDLQRFTAALVWSLPVSPHRFSAGSSRQQLQTGALATARR